MFLLGLHKLVKSILLTFHICTRLNSYGCHVIDVVGAGTAGEHFDIFLLISIYVHLLTPAHLLTICNAHTLLFNSFRPLALS